MGGVKRGDKSGRVAFAFSKNKDVISKYSGYSVVGLDEENPRPEEQRYEHHGERTPLWNATFAMMFFAEVANKVVDNLEVFSPNMQSIMGFLF